MVYNSLRNKYFDLVLFERELALLAAVQVESLEGSDDPELESETRL